MDQSVSCVVYKRGVFVVVVFGSILFRCSCLFGLSGFICDLCLLLAFCHLLSPCAPYHHLGSTINMEKKLGAEILSHHQNVQIFALIR